ncbi:cell death-inducing p53-target protein 1 homolog isoform X2 [Halichondria panicea]|uniref:cell death-inducing p53-target protein 1 homolog isoform X2 n=1 Tax=Halichondria panicea TaxID=6063 RepID=UPI00312BBA27
MAYPMQSDYPPPAPYPSSSGYPEQQPSAPYPTDAAKNPEAQGYPPAPYTQQPGYPAAQYPPQHDPSAPPPPYYAAQQQHTAYPQQQPQQPYGQQASSNVTVVQHQPQPVVYQPRINNSAGQGAMMFALVLTFFALFSGCFWALVCTIPALLLANSATSSARRGQLESAQSNEKISIGCSIAAIVFGVVGTLAIVGGVMAWYFTLFFRF